MYYYLRVLFLFNCGEKVFEEKDKVLQRRATESSLFASFTSTFLHSGASSFAQPCQTPCDPWTVALAARLLCPWDFPGKSTGVGRRVLLQGVFLTQGSNLHHLRPQHWQVGSLPLSLPRMLPASWTLT